MKNATWKTPAREMKLQRIQEGRKIAEQLGEPRCSIADAARAMGISRAAASKTEAIALYKVSVAMRKMATLMSPTNSLPE